MSHKRTFSMVDVSDYSHIDFSFGLGYIDFYLIVNLFMQFIQNGRINDVEQFSIEIIAFVKFLQSDLLLFHLGSLFFFFLLLDLSFRFFFHENVSFTRLL